MDVETVSRGRGDAHVLLISDDVHLIRRMGELADVVGTSMAAVTPRQVSRSVWATSGMVLLDARMASELTAAQLPHRVGAILLVQSADQPGINPWQVALAAGCGEVAILPESEPWLVEQIHVFHHGAPRDGRLVAVMGATGGVGASTLAVGLAVCRPDKRTLVVDTDPLGGGIDVLLGAERTPGIRWPDLLGAQGRLSPATLDYALPHAHGVAMVSFGRGDQPWIAEESMAGLLDAAGRGYDVVVVDLARWWLTHRVPDRDVRSGDDGASIADLVLARADACIVLVRNSVRSVAAATSTIDAIHRRGSACLLAIRRSPRGLSSREVCSALAATSAVDVPDERSVVSAGEAGELPSSRSHLVRACLDLHDRVAA